MNFSKYSRLFSLALLSVLGIGLFFTLQTDPSNDSKENSIPPSAIFPGDRDIGTPSIIPSDRDTKKIEYRNISFTLDKDGGAFESAAAAAAPYGL